MTDQKDRNSELEQDLEVTQDESENVKGGAHPERRSARTRKLRHPREIS